MIKLLHHVSLCWALGAIFALAYDHGNAPGWMWHGKQPEHWLASNAAIGIIAALLAIATRPAPADPFRVPVARGVLQPGGGLYGRDPRLHE